MEHIRKSHSEIIHDVESYKKLGEIGEDSNEKYQQKTIDVIVKRFTSEEVKF